MVAPAASIPRVDLLELIGKDVRLSPAGHEHHGPCPYCGGKDRFSVMSRAERPWWICRQCGRHGDAVDYVRQQEGIGFVEAVTRLGGMPAARYAPEPLRDCPDEGWRDMAAAVVQDAADRLQGDREGRPYTYLTARGLTPATIEEARLGYLPLDGGYHGLRGLRGITIPLYGPDARLYGVTIRRPVSGKDGHKYHMVRGGYHPLYGTAAGLGKLLLVEGYLDCLLARQHVGDLLDVATLGLRQPNGRWFGPLLRYTHIYVCLHPDQAGRDAASKWAWCPRARVLEQPVGEDLTDAVVEHGFDLRGWIAGILPYDAPWDEGRANAMVGELLARGASDPAWWERRDIARRIDSAVEGRDMPDLLAMGQEPGV